MQHRSASRMRDIAPFHVMQLLARAKALEALGNNIVHMEIGEPDFATPAPIVEAGIAALNKGLTHYTPALGLPELRDEISRFYSAFYQVNVASNNIAVTPGSSGALQLVCQVLLNPGDEVLLTDPGYPCNRHFVQLAAGVPRFITLSADNHFNVMLNDIKNNITDKTRAVLLASPSNPTGVVLDKQILNDIAKFLLQKNIYLVLDEIYQGLLYGITPSSIAGKYENVFVINSFSKYFCMTGWRLGWLVAPTEFMPDIDKLAQNIFLAPPTPSQYAALAAFKPETLNVLEQYRSEFESRRDYLYQSLSRLGFEISSKPQGAFYIYVDTKKVCTDSFQFSQDLLEEAGVAITPGIDFGDNQANTRLRFAYTTSNEKLETGISRLESYLS